MRLKIATRASKLALTQTGLVLAALKQRHAGLELEVVEIKTLGDRKQNTEQASDHDKKDWVLDLEMALVRGEVDLAIHSAKDVPSDIEQGTRVLSVLERANPGDVFVGKPKRDGVSRYALSEIEAGSKVGTASLRRQAQLRILRPDLEIVDLRGNVPTRIAKLDEHSSLSGIVLAAAGIERLGLDVDTDLLSTADFVPAVNQGILAVQLLEARRDLLPVVESISHFETNCCFLAERACVTPLGADCKSAVGLYAEFKQSNVQLSARVMRPDGSDCLDVSDWAQPSEVEQLGRRVSEELLKRGAREILGK